MENASKALIIAGSVLIAILLISVGMKIFNSTSKTADSVEDNTKLKKAEIFNDKFAEYSYGTQSSVNIKSLINKVIASNAKNKDNIVKIKIGGSMYEKDTDLTELITSLDTSKSYKVEFMRKKGSRIYKYYNNKSNKKYIISYNRYI